MSAVEELATSPSWRVAGASGLRRAQVEALVRDHMGELRAVAFRVARNDSDADEAVARGLLILHRLHQSVRPDTALPWLKTVVRHEALKVAKGRSDVPAQDIDFTTVPAERAVEDLVEGRERVSRSARALRALKPDQARALMLKAHGLTYEEIAAREGWTYTKVNRCMAEGRAAFLEAFRDQEERMASTTTPEAPEEAPYGYKANGQPRKRPVPHAAISARRNGGSTSKPARTSGAAISRREAQALTGGTLLDRVASEIEQEIARLQKALDDVKAAARL